MRARVREREREIEPGVVVNQQFSILSVDVTALYWLMIGVETPGFLCCSWREINSANMPVKLMCVYIYSLFNTQGAEYI